MTHLHRPLPSLSLVTYHYFFHGSLFCRNPNKERRRELGAAIRHKDVNVCPVGALGFYLLYRFSIEGEAFPTFTPKKEWYKIALLHNQNN